EQKEGAVFGMVDMERRLETWWTGLYCDGPAARFLRGYLLNPLDRKRHHHAFPWAECERLGHAYLRGESVTMYNRAHNARSACRSVKRMIAIAQIRRFPEDGREELFVP